MARSHSTIEHLNVSISLERLIASRGIELSDQGDTLVGACPWCGQGDALVVDPREKTWRCAPCGRGGDVVDWVVAVLGVDRKRAVDLLSRGSLGSSAMGNQELVGDRVGTTPEQNPLADRLTDPTNAPHVIVRAVIDYYHETLKQTPEALAYLHRRGLRDGTMIAQFRLGFSDRTLGYRIPPNNRKAGATIRRALTEAGLIKSTGHEYFRGSLVVPVFEGDRMVQAYGRKVTPNLRKGTPDHLWLPGPRRGVWNHTALGHEEVILCESIIDALTFWCAGYRHVTAVGGPAALTDELTQAIGRSAVKRVVIAFDHDAPGDAGATSAAERLMAVGIDCYRAVFPEARTPTATTSIQTVRQRPWGPS